MNYIITIYTLQKYLISIWHVVIYAIVFHQLPFFFCTIALLKISNLCIQFLIINLPKKLFL